MFQASRHIACYYPYRDEFNTFPVMEMIWAAKKICYLPLLSDMKSLTFARFSPGDVLEPNLYGIPEPVDRSRIIQAEKLDLVLMPLLAFDRQGHRLGTGGGYYDRTFAFLFEQARSLPSPRMVGIGYAAQEAPALPADAWDVLMHAVVTEKEWVDLN